MSRGGNKKKTMTQLEEVMIQVIRVVIWLVALKSIIGFHFPWEPQVKARKETEEWIEKTTEIPVEIKEKLRSFLQRW